MLGYLESDMAGWAPGRRKQRQPCFSGGAIAFLDIAFQAGCAHVFPAVDAAA